MLKLVKVFSAKGEKNDNKYTIRPGVETVIFKGRGTANFALLGFLFPLCFCAVKCCCKPYYANY